MVMLTDLAVAARRSGLRVDEQAGWQSRGHGGMAGVPRSIALHHTAGPKSGEAPSLRIVRDGRSDLPGPLAHFVLGRSGTVYVVAAGQCWHSGATWTANQSNPWAIGIEAEATGVDPWPGVQYDAYLRLVRALCDHYRIPYAAVQGHKEICKPRGRKSDPNFDCNAFRAALARVSGAPAAPSAPTAPPKPKELPEMIERELRPGSNQGRIICPVPSQIVSKGWVSISAQGGISAATVAFQKSADSDGAPPGAGPVWKTSMKNAARFWKEIPAGTEYVEFWIDARGPGSVLIETKAA